MTDLSNLPEDVREAIESGDACMITATNDIGHTLLNNSEWKILRDYILRVTAERDALAKRIADAPNIDGGTVGTTTSLPRYVCDLR